MPASTIIEELRAGIAAIAQNATLATENHFAARAAALDLLEVHILDRIEGLLVANQPVAELEQLKQQAERLRDQLEAIDARLFEWLRDEIRQGTSRGHALRQRIDACIPPDSEGRREQDEPGYDSLDLFINGLLLVREMPEETQEREPEMVYYQQTPARIILELVAQVSMTAEDVFYDIGSGLGHVPILVHLLTGAHTRGIELEPAYCDYARACAQNLNASGAEFIHADARAVDYTPGTMFFLYTPFKGHMLQTVLARLQAVAQTKLMTLCTYGPCTTEVARQPWLIGTSGNIESPDTLCLFKSR